MCSVYGGGLNVSVYFSAAYINSSCGHLPVMGDYLLPFQPSLAQATNTRLDSACKHIQQCRVSTDDMMRFTGEDAVSIHVFYS